MLSIDLIKRNQLPNFVPSGLPPPRTCFKGDIGPPPTFTCILRSVKKADRYGTIAIVSVEASFLPVT